MATPIYFAWRNGYPHRGTDPQRAWEEIEDIRLRHGGVIAPAVLWRDVAARNDSVLREHFEWNDAVAGAKYRDGQARSLLGSIAIKCEEAPEIETRAYSLIREDATEEDEKAVNVYTSTEEALRDPNYRAQLLEHAKRDLESFRRRYSALTELADVLSVIEQVVSA